MFHTILFLICVFSSTTLSSSLSALNSNPNISTISSSFHSDPIAFLESKPYAAIQVLVDSTVEADSEDVAKVLSMLPFLAENISALLNPLARFYRQRCLEVLPSIIIDTFEVCPKPMSTTTDFREFVERLSVEDAAKFFWLPPGSLRDAVRSHLLTLGGFCVQLIKELCDYRLLDMPSCPYAEAITDVKDLLEAHMTNDDFMKVLPIIPVNNAIDKMALIQSAILSTVLPSRMYKQIPGLVCDLGSWPLFWGFMFSKFVYPLPCVDGNLVKTMHADLLNFSEEHMNQYTPLAQSPMDFFIMNAQRIFLRRPEALFFELSAIDDDNFKPWIIKNAERLVSKVVSNIFEHGRQIPIFDKPEDRELVERLLKMIKSDVCRQFHRRVLLPEVKVVSKHPLSDYFGCMKTLPITLADSPVYQKLIPESMWYIQHFSKSTITPSKSFAKSFHANSICNPHTFYRLVTEGEQVQRTKIEMIIRFIGGFRGPICKHKRILGIKMLNHVLSDNDKDKIAIMINQRSPLVIKGAGAICEPVPTTKQKYLLQSLVFRTGSFCLSDDGNESKGVRAQVFEAFEVFASIIFPSVMEMYLAVRDTYGQNPLIEDLFMCDFMDKGWILEHYGSLNDDTNVPTCILRLVDGKREDVVSGLSDYVAGLFSLDHRYDNTYNDCRVRVAELVKHLHKKGQRDTAFKILETVPLSQESIVSALQREPLGEPDSSHCLLLALLSDYTAYTNYGTQFWASRLRYLRPDIAAKAACQFLLSGQWDNNESVAIMVVKTGCPPKYLGVVIKKLFEYSTHPEIDQSISKRIISIAFELIKILPNSKAVSSVLNHVWTLKKTRIFNVFYEFLEHSDHDFYVKATELCDVCLEFKIFMLNLRFKAKSQSAWEKAAVNAWKHIFELVGDEESAKAFLIAELAENNVAVAVEDLDRILLEHHINQKKHIEEFKTPKISNFKMVHCCPRSVHVYINDQVVLVPDNSSTAHLYSAVQRIFKLDKPFRIVDSRTMKVVNFSDETTVNTLGNAKLIIEHIEN